MKNINKIRSEVFKLAYQLKELFFTSFSKCLTIAWKIIKIKFGYTTKIAFAKKDTGEERIAVVIALGSISTIEKGYLRFVEQLEEGVTQWRSFRIENVIV